MAGAEPPINTTWKAVSLRYWARKEAVVMIHGGVGREERLKVQESFKHDPVVQVLLATDAAGEGINLQRAHLMVNYDLPWNPNRFRPHPSYWPDRGMPFMDHSARETIRPP
ncbi:MAG: SWF/SNF helicase family protein [Nitrosospira sp.]|nr:SWF/SNF helicase family protein [Nitrosospira sp.]MDN5882543.1 SWF/SNF helicase family protein [Nitrosospira sp.]MDN5935458.1 SWF/SNF helicase family protein [Nitrosospira sp.]